MRSERAREWITNWPLALASMAGMSLVSVPLYSIGMFMQPMTQDLGWSRTEVSMGLTIYSALAVPLSPLVGALIDRWGPRRLAMPGVIAAGAAYALFGTTSASVVHWCALWVLYTLTNLAIKTTVWTAAVSSAFVHARGLAIAVTISGAAVAQIAAPLVAAGAIDWVGWRSAFVVIGMGWSAIVFALVLTGFRARRDKAAGAAPVMAVAALDGLSLHQAVRDATIWRIGLSTLISATLVTALIVHLPSSLGQYGFSRGEAAQLTSLAGAVALGGKFLCGWILDRSGKRWIGWACQFAVAVGCACLLGARDLPWLATGGVLFLGFAMGSSLQITIYYTTRYAGLRNYGKIFGAMSSALAFSSGVGPLLGALSYDLLGSYQPLLIACVPASLASAALLFGLKPYPVWGPAPADAAPEPAPALRPSTV